MQLIEINTPVVVKQGFGICTNGIVVGTDMRKSRYGDCRYYQVKITGNPKSVKRHANVGKIINARASCVTVST